VVVVDDTDVVVAVVVVTDGVVVDGHELHRTGQLDSQTGNLQNESFKSAHAAKSGVPLQCGVVVVAVEVADDVMVDSTELVPVVVTVEVIVVVTVDVAVDTHVLHMAGHSCRK